MAYKTNNGSSALGLLLCVAAMAILAFIIMRAWQGDATTLPAIPAVSSTTSQAATGTTGTILDVPPQAEGIRDTLLERDAGMIEDLEALEKAKGR